MPRRHLPARLLTFARVLVYSADGRARFIDAAGARDRGQRGLEPDECYMLGKKREVPDIAIEIVVSSGLVDKLEVYRGLGVPEVWIWKDARLMVRCLGETGYEERERSTLLPDLDLAHLASFVALDVNQTQRVKDYRRSLDPR